MLMKKHKLQYSWWRNFFSTPFIFGMIVPFMVFDVSLEVYHHVCFWLYGLPLVDRSRYMIFDRFKLPYLSFPDKIYCLYCSYGNGLMAYASRIAADTESYWCGIKHHQFTGYVEPPHHKDFLEYGDKEAYEKLVQAS